MSESSRQNQPLVVALGASLIFASRLESIVTRAGGSFATARDVEELRARLDAPALVLVDLGARGLDLDAAVAAAREAGARVVAYGPHVDAAARRRALDAGCDRWLPNSKLFESLPGLLPHG